MHASPTQNIGHHTSLALGSDGHRHISYWSLSTGDLNYATTSDMIPPNIGNVSQNPLEDNVSPTDEVKVNVTVTDGLSGVKQVIRVALLDGHQVATSSYHS